jgi:hypothetical protein
VAAQKSRYSFSILVMYVCAYIYIYMCVCVCVCVCVCSYVCTYIHGKIWQLKTYVFWNESSPINLLICSYYYTQVFEPYSIFLFHTISHTLIFVLWVRCACLSCSLRVYFLNFSLFSVSFGVTTLPISLLCVRGLTCLRIS